MGKREDFHVLLIGAGTTGLSIAQGLKKLGVSCTVFERQEQHGYVHWEREWSMALHWGSQYTKHWPVEIQQDLKSAQNDPDAVMTDEQEKAFPLINGATGEVFMRAPAASTRRVSRTKLRLLLSRGVDVRYGKKFVRLDDDGTTITAYFEDGSSAKGACLVGCDSAKSVVRKAVLPLADIQLEVTPALVFNLTQTYTAEQAKFIRSFYHPMIMIAPHPAQETMALICIADVKDPDRPEEWVFQLLYSKWGTEEPAATNEERLAQLKEIGQLYCEPFKSAAKWVKDDTHIYPDRLKEWPNPPKWDSHGGRVTLAGDAAHPMAPYRGQGLNNALEDAAYYVSLVADVLEGKQSLRNAVAAYDEEMRHRGAKEVETTRKQAWAWHHWDEFMSSPIAKHGVQKIVDAD
ncbi:MAG: hypothetical protein M1822_005581 [Bathelium mastoideum]|nr:MAG: hypothetical protein M1822_005581 [Bathelium mastoideum]